MHRQVVATTALVLLAFPPTSRADERPKTDFGSYDKDKASQAPAASGEPEKKAETPKEKREREKKEQEQKESRAIYEAEEKADGKAAEWDFSEAAAVLERLPPSDSFDGARIGREISKYRRLARLQEESKTSTPALKEFLRSVLPVSGTASAMGWTRDPQVPARILDLVAALKKMDPDAAAALSRRKVKVAVNDGEGLTPAIKKRLAERVVLGLRSLGMDADPKVGDDLYVIDAKVEGPSPVGGAIPLIHCILTASASWSAKEKLLFGAMDLSLRVVNALESRCMNDLMGKMGSQAAYEVLRSYLRSAQ
jgi:hypothetical protein